MVLGDALKRFWGGSGGDRINQCCRWCRYRRCCHRRRLNQTQSRSCDMFGYLGCFFAIGQFYALLQMQPLCKERISLKIARLILRMIVLR